MFGSLGLPDAVAIAKVTDFAAFFGVVSICAGVLYVVYRVITPNEADELEFASTVFILTIAIGLLVSIIKSAPAISFGLFGAMSIVRFRAQVKRPQRMIFIFMAAAIGVCCGAGEYLTTVLGTIVLSALTLMSFWFVPIKIKSKNKPTAAMATLPVPAPLTPATGGRWGVDFLPAMLGDGRRVRVLAIVDEVSREALATIPETSFSGARVVGELDRLIAERGKPQQIVSDSWPQFASSAVLDWKRIMAIDWLWLEHVAKPEPFIVAFTSIVRDHGFAGHGYPGLIEARSGLESWRIAYNREIDAGGKMIGRLERPIEHTGPRLAVTTQRDAIQVAGLVEAGGQVAAVPAIVADVDFVSAIAGRQR